MDLDLTTSVGLSNQYLRYNKKYFLGRLPRIGVLWRKPYDSNHAAEFVTYTDGVEVILINPKLKRFENYTLQTMLHEMCHVKLRNHPNPKVCTGHGKLFHKEMLRLAKLGAFRSLW